LNSATIIPEREVKTADDKVVDSAAKVPKGIGVELSQHEVETAGHDSAFDKVKAMIHDCVDQFDDEILDQQIQRIVDDAWWSKVFTCSSFGDNRGEIVFQQAVYPPFTLVLLAAAGNDLVCVADQDVLSSSCVVCSGSPHVVSGQPDAGLKLRSGDPLAEVEIKAVEDQNQQDVAKCVLWSSITGQALQEMGVDRESISIPFLIGSGFRASQYKVTFPHSDDEYRPDVSYVCCESELRNTQARTHVFVSFVKLVGNLKRTCIGLGRDKLASRQKHKGDFPNIFSSPAKKKKTERGTIRETHSEESSSVHAEIDAKMAAVKACPSARRLERPWQRQLRLCSGSDLSHDYNQKSPFYFRGQYAGSLAFYKVWRLDDRDVIESVVLEEVSFNLRALEAGLSVPAIFHKGFVEMHDSKYYVLAMLDAGSSHSVADYDELLFYALSLLHNVHRLHSRASLLHCDIKPDNVLWDAKRSDITLIDFGNAQTKQNATSIRGTKGFTAPEVENGANNTCSSDAYSVGATLLALYKGIQGLDWAGICDIARSLMRPNPSGRPSLDEAYETLKTQVNKGQSPI